MPQTKLSNLVNPQVMGDMISHSLPKKIKFAPLARMDSTLAGQAGDSITLPVFNYIGDADDLTEGVAMGTVVLTASTKSFTIKQAGKAVEVTDKAVNSGYGDPLGNANAQIEDSIAAKVDNDCVVALGGAALTHDSSAAVISYNVVVDAVDKFVEEDDEEKILFIHPNQKGTLRKDPQFIANVPNAYMKGVIGELGGCQVVASAKVPLAAGVYTNYIVKPGALAIYLKADTNIETDRDILAKTTVIAGDKFYVAALENSSKVVKLSTKA
ncbi:MAG: N4-gp56 family major capsid protein [Bacillota bacterium]